MKLKKIIIYFLIISILIIPNKNQAYQEQTTQEVIPDTTTVPLEEIYSEEMQEKYGNVDIAEETLPSSFNLGNKINIVKKDQGTLGICYSYITTTSVETNLLLKKGITKDFSEVHAAVVSKQGRGGSFYSLYNDYYVNGYGPVSNSEWDESNLITKIFSGDLISSIVYAYCATDRLVTNSQLQTAINEMKKTTPEYYVMGYTRFPSISGQYKKSNQYKTQVEDGRNQIKTHIKNYGSVYAAISSPNNTNICNTNSQGIQVMNTPTDTTVTHGVSLVGWDDNFKASNFPSSMGVTKDGAYLALNSWGSSGGYDGYMWISYEDWNIEKYAYGVNEVSAGKMNINKTSISLGKTSYIYDGTVKTPYVKIIYNGETLVKDTDYTLEYQNNISAGTAKVIIKGIGRYTGSITKTYKINPINIANLNITLSSTTYRYTGTQRKPKVTVKYR